MEYNNLIITKMLDFCIYQELITHNSKKINEFLLITYSAKFNRFI